MDEDTARPFASHPLILAGFPVWPRAGPLFSAWRLKVCEQIGQQSKLGSCDSTGFLGKKFIAFLEPGTAHTSGRMQKSLVWPKTPSLTSVSSGTQGTCRGQASPWACENGGPAPARSYPGRKGVETLGHMHVLPSSRIPATCRPAQFIQIPLEILLRSFPSG